MFPRLLVAVLLLLLSVPAQAHSYADPALRTVLDGVSPALPTGVVVEVVPSVVDELRLTNPTAQPLEVLAVGGEPFLMISADGVLANLASPDWYLTGTPEGGPPVPADVLRQKGKGPARWLRVSRDPVWTEFDPRLRPDITVPPDVRAKGQEAVLAVWRIPLRYAGKPLAATGHVAFTPIRGGFTVSTDPAPAGLTVTPLQGELPGLLLKVGPGLDVTVLGSAGEPFLRLAHDQVQAYLPSPSWAADQRARGRTVQVGDSWALVGRGATYSWLDPRLRYPSDLPPADVLARSRPTVVQTWSIPVTIDGAAKALTGTVTWVPRAVATRALGITTEHSRAVWPYVAGGGLIALLGILWWRRRS